MIEVKGLQKRFKVTKDHKLQNEQKADPRSQDGYFYSVRDVSFHCNNGEVLGLLGPNGAGKTTTLRMLSTALSPDAGQIMINGVDVVKDPLLARKKIGFLSGSTGLYGRLTVKENIEYFARLHGMNAQQIKHKTEELYALLDMESYLNRRAEHLSTGMKQKTSIARAVVHSPEVVILDEPTTGLDIMATQTVIRFIQGLSQAGTPVIFSTHHLDEIQLLCQRVTMIDQGVSCFDGSLAEFKARASSGILQEAFMNVLSGAHHHLVNETAA